MFSLKRMFPRGGEYFQFGIFTFTRCKKFTVILRLLRIKYFENVDMSASFLEVSLAPLNCLTIRIDRHKAKSKEKAMRKMRKMMAKSGPLIRSEMSR